MTTQEALDPWPVLDYLAGKDTIDALHMRAQVVGKVKVALTRTSPEWQNAPLFVTGRGLTTGLLHGERTGLEIAFDFVNHRLDIVTTDGRRGGTDLSPSPLCNFTADVLAELDRLGVDVAINPVTVEMPNPVRCDVDEGYDSYDPAVANTLFRLLSQTATVFEEYRAGFWGKQPPVAFWWGTFDLAVTRFDLVPVPVDGGMDRISRVAMDSAQASVGFWPGNDHYPKPAFFGYTFPKPDGLEAAIVQPEPAGWNADIGEFLLDYDDARAIGDPRRAILEFANTTYEAGAELAGWDRALLERPLPL